MIKKLFCVMLVWGGLASCVLAKPMDTQAAKHIPELRRIAICIRNGRLLSQEECIFIAQCIDSRDPVLLSASAWIVGEDKRKDERLSDKLKAVQQDKLDEMSIAFIRIALEKRESRKRGHLWKPSTELQDDANPYLRIETTRELLIRKDDEGMAALKKLQADKSPMVKAAAESFFIDAASSTKDSRARMLDERYELLLSIIQEK